jgi:cytoskeletal protein RodZ
VADDQDSSQSTLGEFLRHERERRGITIEQVASATKIGVRLLHLLESDQYVELPAKPFIRGFVASYCRFIGIDGKEVLIRYGSFLVERSSDRPTRDEGHSGYAFEKREGEQSRTGLTITMAIFIVLGGLAFFILKPSLHHHHGSHADKLREANESPTPSSSPSPSPSSSDVSAVAVMTSATPSPTPTASPSLSPSSSPTPKMSVPATPLVLAPSGLPEEVEPSPSPSPSSSKAPKSLPSPTTEKPDPLNSGVNLKGSEIKYKILLKTSADIWVRYQVDTRPKMKFILRANRVLVLRAQETVRFQASIPEAIMVRVNGGAEHPMTGDSNAVMRGKDLTLFFPKQVLESTEEPFPGEHALLGTFVPAGKGAVPSPSPSL